MRGSDIDGRIARAIKENNRGDELTTQQIAELVPALTLKQVQSAMARMSSRGNGYGIARVRKGIYRMALRRSPAVVAAEQGRPQTRAAATLQFPVVWTVIKVLRNGDALLEDGNSDVWRATKIG